ncbi:MAG: hypothetical protein ACFE7S_08515 [Candidatus Hodarchaeota archaeon]
MIKMSKCPKCGHVHKKIEDVLYRRSGSKYIVRCQKCYEEYYDTDWVDEKLEEKREYFG